MGRQNGHEFPQSAAVLEGPQAGQVSKISQLSPMGPLETASAATVPERHEDAPMVDSWADFASVPSNTDTEQPTRGLPGCPSR